MTPAETLEAAIAKLDRLARERTQGRWDVLYEGGPLVALHEGDDDFDYIRTGPTDGTPNPDTELIATLAASATALLAVIRDGLRWEREVVRKGGANRSQSDDLVVALAAALLGSGEGEQ